MSEKIDSSGVSKIAFTRDKNGNLFNGMTICINDMWGSNISISKYIVNGNKFSGTLHFNLYDHFGLDIPDVEKVYVNLDGFRAWFVLQHYTSYNGSYKPFINLFEYDIPFSGEF